jgi:hypothetical protein
VAFWETIPVLKDALEELKIGRSALKERVFVAEMTV